jgi:hypothetical protein
MATYHLTTMVASSAIMALFMISFLTTVVIKTEMTRVGSFPTQAPYRTTVTLIGTLSCLYATLLTIGKIQENSRLPTSLDYKCEVTKAGIAIPLFITSLICVGMMYTDTVIYECWWTITSVIALGYVIVKNYSISHPMVLQCMSFFGYLVYEAVGYFILLNDVYTPWRIAHYSYGLVTIIVVCRYHTKLIQDGGGYLNRPETVYWCARHFRYTVSMYMWPLYLIINFVRDQLQRCGGYPSSPRRYPPPLIPPENVAV